MQSANVFFAALKSLLINILCNWFSQGGRLEKVPFACESVEKDITL